MPKTGVGIIGCGNIFNRHADAVKGTPFFSLEMVSDIVAERSEKAAAVYSVKGVTENARIFENKKIGLVSICTPIGTHEDLAIEALENKKHVLIEKPVGLNIKKIDRIQAVAEKENRMAFVVHQVRLNEAVEELKKAVDAGHLGGILSAAMVVRWFRPREYFDGWFGKKEMAGGSIMNQGIHYIDILQWVLGMPAQAMGVSRNLRYSDIEVEDFDAGIFLHRGGVVSTFESNVITYDKNFETTFTVTGKNGTVKIGGQAMQVLDHWNVRAWPAPVISGVAAPNVYQSGKYYGSVPNHIKVYQEYQKALEKKPNKSVSIAESKKSVVLAKAVLESSSKKNAWVQV
jgi:predicted dehydrogenase